jgi:hypothetical protein
VAGAGPERDFLVGDVPWGNDELVEPELGQDRMLAGYLEQ